METPPRRAALQSWRRTVVVVEGIRTLVFNPKVVETYGSWMLVSRKNRKVYKKRDVRGDKDRMHDSQGAKIDLHDNGNLAKKEFSAPCN